MSDDGLFDATPYVVAPRTEPVPEKASETVRRTARQLVLLARGIHPLTMSRLHADAAPYDDRQAAGLRCRGCRFRQMNGGHSRDYPKCFWPDPNRYRLEELPRVTLGAATDCRGWWPACVDYEPAPPIPPKETP